MDQWPHWLNQSQAICAQAIQTKTLYKTKSSNLTQTLQASLSQAWSQPLIEIKALVWHFQHYEETSARKRAHPCELWRGSRCIGHIVSPCSLRSYDEIASFVARKAETPSAAKAEINHLALARRFKDSSKAGGRSREVSKVKSRSELDSRQDLCNLGTEAACIKEKKVAIEAENGDVGSHRWCGESIQSIQAPEQSIAQNEAYILIVLDYIWSIECQGDPVLLFEQKLAFLDNRITLLTVEIALLDDPSDIYDHLLEQERSVSEDLSQLFYEHFLSQGFGEQSDARRPNFVHILVVEAPTERI